MLFKTVSASFARRRGISNSSLQRSFASTPLSRIYTAPTNPTGVAFALQTIKEKPSSVPITPQLHDGFSLTNRVAVVSGGNRGLGLEMALVLAEAGAKVYVLDLPKEPGEEFCAVREYVRRFSNSAKWSESATGLEGAELVYVEGGVDVTEQKRVWDVVRDIGDREGRMDVGIAAAGILQETEGLRYEAEEFQKVMNVNVNGVLYTAQAVGQQMERFKIPGSIILIASMSGSITNRDHPFVAYNTSKSAVIQMARSLACELGSQGIRVNSLSPGHIYTKLTAAYLDTRPELFKKWGNANPLGRIGRPDELRGVIAWLASDMSTFCTGSDILVSGGHHAW